MANIKVFVVQWCRHRQHPVDDNNSTFLQTAKLKISTKFFAMYIFRHFQPTTSNNENQTYLIAIVFRIFRLLPSWASVSPNWNKSKMQNSRQLEKNEDKSKVNCLQLSDQWGKTSQIFLGERTHLEHRARGYKTFFMLNSAENEICSAYKKLNANNLYFFPAKQMKFFLLINIKMPTIVGILIFISRKNFMLNWVECEKCFITSGPGHRFFQRKPTSVTSCLLSYKQRPIGEGNWSKRKETVSHKQILSFQGRPLLTREAKTPGQSCLPVQVYPFPFR